MEAALIRARAEREVVAAIARWCKRPMEWGVDDCMLAVADVIKAVTGKDPAAPYRGRYSSRREAYRAMGKGGVKATAARAAREFGFKRVNPLDAQPGDPGITVAAVKMTKRGQRCRYAVVVCRRQGWFAARTENGGALIPATRVLRAWSII